MATILLSSNKTNIILKFSKSSPLICASSLPFSQSYTLPSSASFSSALERAEGSNAVAEAEEEEGESEDSKDGPTKAVESSETVHETGKHTMDGAWAAAKDTARSPNSISQTKNQGLDYDNYQGGS